MRVTRESPTPETSCVWPPCSLVLKRDRATELLPICTLKRPAAVRTLELREGVTSLGRLKPSMRRLLPTSNT